MALIDLWKKNEAEFKDKKINQILGMAGDGVLTDGRATSTELRQLFSELETDKLLRYV